MESIANQVKYFIEYLWMKMVLGILLWIIVVIIVIIVAVSLLIVSIVALFKFLFQLFFVIPVGTDYSADFLYAKEILLPMN